MKKNSIIFGLQHRRANVSFKHTGKEHKRESDRARSAVGDTTEYQKGQPSGP